MIDNDLKIYIGNKNLTDTRYNEAKKAVDTKRDILHEIARTCKARVESEKKVVPLSEMKELAERTANPNFAFEKALRKSGVSFICEVKKASPSKGLISAEFEYLRIAKEYEAGGASCVSVLTEPQYFLGSDKYLSEIASSINIPVLRKDFFVDEYMIYGARAFGASAVLLIVGILSREQITQFFECAESLGLSAIFEVHDESELEVAVEVGARIIGVNNRNLKTFEIDINNSARLKKLAPADVIFIAESGMSVRDDIVAVERAGIDGVLVGETLMRASDIAGKLRELKGE